MNLRQIIKLPEYKKYKYKPLYYDKRKEILDAKIQKAKDKKETIEKGEYRPDFKGKFRSSYRREITQKQKRTAKIRFFLLIIFFSVLAYIIIQKSDVLGKIFDVFLTK